jgi:hypothetical protein
MEILGRSDRVDLPVLGLENIHAKIDTGAYTSSLHCLSAEVVGDRLEFVLLDEEHPEFTGKTYTFKKFNQREIRNSFGEAEYEYIDTPCQREWCGVPDTTCLNSRLARELVLPVGENLVANFGAEIFVVAKSGKILQAQVAVAIDLGSSQPRRQVLAAAAVSTPQVQN